jgi:hypothetical protein
LAFGISGLSVIADSLSAIKYGKVYPIKDERGLITDFKVRVLLLLLLLLRLPASAVAAIDVVHANGTCVGLGAVLQSLQAKSNAC